MKKIIFLVLSFAALNFSPAVANALPEGCQAAEEMVSAPTISPEEDAFIRGRELAADVTEAIKANPFGFQHRDAEAAIVNNLGDLAGEASHYLEQSAIWTNSNKMQNSMDDLNSGLKNFNQFSTLLNKAMNNGILGKIFGNEARRKRQIADLVDSLRLCKFQIQVCKVDLSRTMDDYESLVVKFSTHMQKMQASIGVLKNAIEIMKAEPLLTEEERVKGVYQLERYLNNVTTSITTSRTSLSMLSTQFTSTDHVVKKTEDELTQVLSALTNRGVSTDLFKTPYFVRDALVANPHVGDDVTTAFYSGKSDEDTVKYLHQLRNSGHGFAWSHGRDFTVEESLVILKLLPRGTKSRDSWKDLLVGGNDLEKWTSSLARSTDILILFEILHRTKIDKDAELTIERANFSRLRDYVEDILEKSISLNSGEANAQFRKDVRESAIKLLNQIIDGYGFVEVKAEIK